MLRSTGFAIAFLMSAAGVAAQQVREPQTLDELVDFVIRPSQAEEFEPEEEDIWTWDNEPEPAPLEGEVGPPLAGPTGEEAIGPPLAGPIAPPDIEERRLQDRRVAPFAADGIRVGPFVIRPSIEIGVTATDNVSGVEGGPGAVGTVVAPALNAVASDDRYDIAVDVAGEAVFYDREDFDTQNGYARVSGRYDLTSRTSVVGEGGYSLTREDFSDPNTPDAASERPAVHEFDIALGVEQNLGPFMIRPTVFVDRSLHDDVELASGIEQSRRELDNVEYGGRLRAGAAAGPQLRPFVEAAVGRRDHDQEVDDSGFRRSSTWGELLGGLVIDRGEKLSGEMSVGYRHEDIDDGRLSDVDVFLANASILWSPRRLTEVRVDLYTDVQPSSTPDESASVLYSGLLTVARSLTPHVRLEGGGGLEYRHGLGDGWHDVTFLGFAEASYAFNRFSSIGARYEYEQVESTEAGNDAQSHTVEVRFRLQR
jgi:hypothetical protein